MALPFIPVADVNQAHTFIEQVRVLVAEMKCAERLPRALLLCGVPLVWKCTALELFRAEIIARKCTVRICIVRTYPARSLVSADAGSRNSTMRKWGCGAGSKPFDIHIAYGHAHFLYNVTLYITKFSQSPWLRYIESRPD